MTGGDPLARLAADPSRTALLFDVDGVLAPIAARPEQARVPRQTREQLQRLADRYALVACVSGRTGADAAKVVGLGGLVYVGVHGLELEPDALQWVEPLRRFASTVDWPVEDKVLTVSFHYRGALDERAARAELEKVAARAADAGLVPSFGRKVLEVRPPVPADKGTAVRALLGERGLRRALYAGDDTTDLDAFRGLREAALDLSVAIAVGSAEAPEALRRRADIVVESPQELVPLLQRL